MLSQEERREIGLARELLRKRADLTQVELASRSGVEQRSVRRAEDGESINEETLRRLAAGLGVDFALYADGRASVAVHTAPIPAEVRP